MEVCLLSFQLLLFELLLVLPLDCSQGGVLDLEEALREICPLELHLTIRMVVVEQGQLDIICLRNITETSLGKRVQPKFEWHTACDRMLRLELVRVIDLWHNL